MRWYPKWLQEKWHKWYAWRPVRFDYPIKVSGAWVWREWVERKSIGWGIWMYRDIQETEQ